MKPETMVDAMLIAHRELLFDLGKFASAQETKEHKRYRQEHAFRDGILLRYHAKEIAIAAYKELVKEQAKRIEELEEEVSIKKMLLDNLLAKRVKLE